MKAFQALHLGSEDGVSVMLDGLDMTLLKDHRFLHRACKPMSSEKAN